MEESEASMYTDTASLEAPRNGGLWVVQVLGATLFFIAGFAKVSGDEQIIQALDALGIGQWLRYVTGLIELAAAILLLIPPLFRIGAFLFVPTMVAAILTHLLIIGGSPALPIGLLIIVSIVAWGRKEETLRLIRRNDPRRATEATERMHFQKIS
jgi:putative oxidoreductase